MEQEQPVNAIETTYKGYEFRSRLEAKWACVFDQLWWPWEYEPIDLNGYIPDFHVDLGRTKFFVEIKPAMTKNELVPALDKAAKALGDRDEQILVLGGSIGQEDPREYRWNPVALMTQYAYAEVDDVYLARCPTCLRIVPLTIFGIWGFPCCAVPNGENKHYNHELPITHEDIEPVWAAAHNATKWKPNRG